MLFRLKTIRQPSKEQWTLSFPSIDGILLSSTWMTFSFFVVPGRQHRTSWHLIGPLDVAVMTLKLKNCTFSTEATYYPGHVIRSGCLELAKNTIDSLAKLEHPSTHTDLFSFLGLYNVFRRPVPNFTRHSALLNKTLRNEKPKRFGPLEKRRVRQFRRLKRLL